jgi:peroxiredoxin
MKEKTILILTIFLTTIIFAQNKNITAEITGFKNQTKVKLFDQDLQKLIDSTFVINNKFTLKNIINNTIPRNLSLVLIPDGTPISVRLYIANENIRITGDKADFPYDLKITGSKNEDLQNSLNQQVKTIENERTEIVKFWRTEVKDTGEIYKNKLRLSKERARQIDAQNDSIRIKFMKNNINSYVALNQLRYLKYNYSKDELKNIFKSLEDKYKKCDDGKSLLNYIEIGDIVKEGDLYSDFEAKDQNGKKHKLSDFKGNFILLDFTKEYCAPCEAAIKELKKINAKYGGKIKIISFTGEKSELFWQKGIIRNNINWLCLWDGQGNSGKTLMKYGVQGFPNFFLINPEGKIVKNINGYSDGILEPEIEKLINK